MGRSGEHTLDESVLPAFDSLFARGGEISLEISIVEVPESLPEPEVAVVALEGDSLAESDIGEEETLGAPPKDFAPTTRAASDVDTEPHAAPHSTEPLGPYTPIRALGRLDGVETQLACQMREDGSSRPCVLRRLLVGQTKDWAMRRDRFVAESKLALSLRHPNLVAVIDAEVHPSGPYLVRELVSGANLGEIRTLAGALSPATVAAIGWQIAQGLSYIHNKSDDKGPLGLVHGELSPSTVLLSRRGQVKLTEPALTSLEGRRLTALTGGRAGRPGYAAPEQEMGLAVDARSDLFSAGVLLAELLLGATDGPGVLAERLRMQAVLHPGSASLVETLLRLLEPRPNDRLPNAEALAEALFPVGKNVRLEAEMQSLFLKAEPIVPMSPSDSPPAPPLRVEEPPSALMRFVSWRYAQPALIAIIAAQICGIAVLLLR